jgi:kinesin family protein 5
VGPEI